MAVQTVKWYVDPDAVGGGTGVDWANAYTSLSAFEAAEGADLTNGDVGDPVDGAIYRVNHRSSSGGDDTTTFRFDSFTDSATQYVLVTGDSADGGDFPLDGILDETKYLLHNNDSATQMIEGRQDYLRFEKIQWKVTETGGNVRNAFAPNVGTDGANDLRVDSCIFKGVCSGTGGATAIVITSDFDITISNTIITGFFISADNQFRGIDINCDTANMYNCTIYNCSRGISRAGGVATAINCAVFNCDDDIAGTVGATYTATDEVFGGVGNVTISQSADDWAALVVDAAGDDFHVTDASSELYQTGNGATPKALFTDDIEDNTRDAVDLNWDIGAFELVVGGGGTLSASVFDSISIQDVLDAHITPYKASVFDSVGLTDVLDAHITPLKGTVFDSIGLTDVPTQHVTPIKASVFDSIGLTDEVSAAFRILSASVFDGIGLTEDVNAAWRILSAAVFDGIGLTESVTNIIGSWLDIDGNNLLVGGAGVAFCGDDGGSESIENSLDGTNTWVHDVNEDHYFILNLGASYNLTKVRGRSNALEDPIDVNIYVSNDTGNWGVAVATNITIWQDTTAWVEVDITNKTGRYIKVEIVDTESVGRGIEFGDNPAFKIFDAFGAPVAVILEAIVYDTLGLTDNAVASLPLMATCFDSISLTDLPTIHVTPLGAIVFDTIAMTDATTAEVLSFLSNIVSGEIEAMPEYRGNPYEFQRELARYIEKHLRELKSDIAILHGKLD